MAQIIVILLRLILPISIFKYPLWGGVLSMLLDGADVILVDYLADFFGEPRGFKLNYHFLDKWLDMYYFTFELVMSLRWQDRLAKNTSILLFTWRTLGFAAFELTGIRKILFFAPNLFENFFLYYLAAKKYFPKFMPKTVPQITLVLILLYIPKFAQEYILHYKQLQPWNWFKTTFLS